MCSSKTKLQNVSHINGRSVLQPAACNRVPLLDRRNSAMKASLKSKLQPLSPPPPGTTAANAKTRLSVTTPPVYPKIKSPRQPAVKRSNDPNGLNSSIEKVQTPKGNIKALTPMKKSKKCSRGVTAAAAAPPASDSPLAQKYSASLIVEAPGSIAAARREQVATIQMQRKMRIAHYGRTKSAKFESKVVPTDSSVLNTNGREEKRCSFITSNSDPIYVAYHDEEWGVPTHDDKLLFELLVLTGAQVGSDWATVLRKREEYRDAFSGFDAEIVSKFTEKKITSISAEYGIEISQVRGVVDNSNRILEVKREFGLFDKYLWGFINNKPIVTQYKSSHRIPVKTSKSEAISKDMVRRGFRFVGPTVIHSFMQAAGLSNDHLISCLRHPQCVALASLRPSTAPSL